MSKGVTVQGYYFICSWSPPLHLLLGSFFPALKPSETVFKVVFWLGYFNSCINPMIYPCSSKEFQRAFTRLLRCQCNQKQRVLRRFYDQRWRTAVKGMTRDQRGDYTPGYAVHEPCGGSLMHKRKRCSLAFKQWSLFPPLQKSSFQFKEKVNNLSNKFKGGTGKGGTPGTGRPDTVDTVSMGIYNSCEQSSYQFYDLAECHGLKETDIWASLESLLFIFKGPYWTNMEERLWWSTIECSKNVWNQILTEAENKNHKTWSKPMPLWRGFYFDGTSCALLKTKFQMWQKSLDILMHHASTSDNPVLWRRYWTQMRIIIIIITMLCVFW